MFGLGKSKNTQSKVQKEAQITLADLRLELQDMDIQLITYNHHRNAILEKIKYFESKLPVEEETITIDKPTGNIVVTQKLDNTPKAV